MICRLCLQDSEQYKNIFDIEWIEFNIALIIKKYLYLEVSIDDKISTDVCDSCSAHLGNFHKFYCRIEETQSKLSEKFYIKEEEHFFDNDNISTDSRNNSLQLQENESLKNLDETLHEIKNEEVDACNDEKCLSKKHEKLQINNEEMKSKRKRGRPKKTLKSLPKQNKAKEIFTPKRRNQSIKEEKNESVVKRLRRKRRNSTDSKSEGEHNCNSLEENQNKKKLAKEKTIKSSEYLKKCKEVNENIAKYMKMQCELCSVECPTFTLLREHFRQVHRRLGYVRCCNKKFFRPGLLWEHIKKHLNPNYFRCELCDKTFSDGKCLQQHNLNYHTPEDGKIHKCDECPKSFPRLFMLEKHKLSHMPQEERKFFCELCGKAFASKNWLQGHIRLTHENANGIMCHICGKVCQGKKFLERHQLEHDGKLEPKIQCQECGAWLKDKYGLKRHMERHVDREKELSNPKDYICDICGKVSTSKRGLSSHIQYKHQMKPRHKCNICGKTFKRPIALKEHLTTHTGEMLYTCPHCPKTFNSSANMHSHRKKKHREEWEANRRNREKMQEVFKERNEMSGVENDRKDQQDNTNESSDDHVLGLGNSSKDQAKKESNPPKPIVVTNVDE